MLAPPTPPIKAAPPAKHETWQDWVPAEADEGGRRMAEPLMTLGELLATLSDPGVTGGELGVSASDLTYWQSHGVIPYPIRRRHNGATRALYPQWMVDVIVLLRSLQGQGYKVRDLAPLLRGDVYHLLTERWFRGEREHRLQEIDRLVAKRTLALLLDRLDDALREIAVTRAWATGSPVSEIDVVVRDFLGEETRWRYEWPDETPTETH